LSGDTIIDTIINEVKGMRYIPSSRETFRDWFESEQKLTYYFLRGSLRYRVYIDDIYEEEIDNSGYVITVNDEIINEFDTFINSISQRSDIPAEVMNIIKEDIDLYPAGSKTSNETAKTIQNRFNIYLNEIK
jgi:hypothetical protein